MTAQLAAGRLKLSKRQNQDNRPSVNRTRIKELEAPYSIR